jgi:hypothetical protein
MRKQPFYNNAIASSFLLHPRHLPTKSNAVPPEISQYFLPSSLFKAFRLVHLVFTPSSQCYCINKPAYNCAHAQVKKEKGMKYCKQNDGPIVQQGKEKNKATSSLCMPFCVLPIRPLRAHHLQNNKCVVPLPIPRSPLFMGVFCF